MDSSEAILIHKQLHEKSVGDVVLSSAGSKYLIRFRKSNKCKYCLVKNVCFIEQNDQSESDMAERARNGEKITWIVCGNSCGLLVGDEIERSCTALNSKTPFVKLDKDTLLTIHKALHDTSKKYIDVDEQRFYKQIQSKSKCQSFTINGTDFVEQNKKKSSDWAKKAKNGTAVTWVLVSNAKGPNAHKSWGLIVGKKIEKDCLIFQTQEEDTKPLEGTLCEEEQAVIVFQPTTSEEKSIESQVETIPPSQPLFTTVEEISEISDPTSCQDSLTVKRRRVPRQRRIIKVIPEFVTEEEDNNPLKRDMTQFESSIIESPGESISIIRSQVEVRKRRKRNSSSSSQQLEQVIEQF